MKKLDPYVFVSSLFFLVEQGVVDQLHESSAGVVSLTHSFSSRLRPSSSTICI